MAKDSFIYTDPTVSNFTTSDTPTPYGIYDNDNSFISESIDVAKYVSRKLGHPVMQLEFNSSSIWACFEEATSDYSQMINQYNMKNWLWDNYAILLIQKWELVQLNQLTQEWVWLFP